MHASKPHSPDEHSTALMRWLAQVEEPELRTVICNLLTTMGYKQVTLSHGALELGRDIVFCEVDRIGRHIWRGVQVKAQPVGGSMGEGGIRTLVNQCEASLDSPYTTATGSEVMLAEIWIVNSRQLTEQAKLSIRGKLRNNQALEIIDGPRLVDLLNHYLPQLLQDQSAPLEKYLTNLSQFCDTTEDYLSARFGTRIHLSECYVEPTAYLTALVPRAVHCFSEATRACGLATLIDEIDGYRRLAEQGLLWHSMQVRAVNLLTRLESFRSACADSGIDLQLELTELGEAISALAEFLQIQGTDDQLRNNPELSSNVTPQRLEELADAYLRNLVLSDRGLDRQYSILDPITTPRKKLGSAPPSTFLDERRAKETAVKALAAFENCYANLTEAYTGKAWAAPAFIPVCAKVLEHLLADDSPLPTLVDPKGRALCRRLSVVLDTIVGELIRHYTQQADKLFNGDGDSFVYISDSQVSAALALSRLTDVLGTLLTFDNSDLTQLRLQRPQSLLASVNKIALIADLGFGKSTALKRLAHAAIADSGALPEKLMPVFVVLASVGSELRVGIKAQLLEAATHTISQLDDQPVDQFLWLLDGLDEMQSEGARRGVIHWMLGSDEDSPKRVWLTSRPAALAGYIPGLRKARLAPFGIEQIDEFIAKFPWTTATAAQSLKTTLSQAPDLAELAQMPLLLTLLALLSDVEEGVLLPRRREGIYERILNLFMGDWDRAKGIKRVYKIRDQSDRLQLLARAALDLYSRRRRSFSREEFIRSFAQYLPGELEAAFSTAEVSLDELLRDSLIVQQSGGLLSFFHFSVHEYLTALSLTSQVSTSGIWAAVTEYFRDGWWEEVLIFYAGIKRDVGPLINELHRHLTAGTGAQSERLHRLLIRWLTVADFTSMQQLRPTGSVATVLLQIDPGLERYQYRIYNE
jgi:Restriction endonuclease